MALYNRLPARIKPLLQPNVLTMINVAMKINPIIPASAFWADPIKTDDAATPTRS